MIPTFPDCVEALVTMDRRGIYVTLSAKSLAFYPGDERRMVENIVKLTFEHPERIQITKLEVSQ